MFSPPAERTGDQRLYYIDTVLYSNKRPMNKSEDYFTTKLIELFKTGGMVYVIDALLASPPGHTESIQNLGRRTRLSQQAVVQCLDELQSIGVVKINEEERTYTIQRSSDVLDDLVRLNGALNASVSDTTES